MKWTVRTCACHPATFLLPIQSSNIMYQLLPSTKKEEIVSKFIRFFPLKMLKFCVGLEDLQRHLPIQTIL